MPIILIVVIGFMYMYVEVYRSVHFTYVQLIFYQTYFNKALKKQSQSTQKTVTEQADCHGVRRDLQGLIYVPLQ